MTADDNVIVVAHDVVEDAARSAEIALIEDLVLGKQSGDQNYIFSTVADIAVDSLGNMFILDAQNQRVQEFDPAGGYIRTFGGPGEGPGEYGRVGMLAVSEPWLIITDPGRWELSTWTLDGTHVRDIRLPHLFSLYQFFGTRNGSTLATYVNMGGRGGVGSDQRNWTLASLAHENGSPQVRASIPRGRPTYARGDRTITVHIEHLRHPRIDFDHTTEQVYLSSMREYEVWAMSLDGQPNWVLRVPMERQPFHDEARARGLENARRLTPMLPSNSVDWPAEMPALSFMGVDGHGHLYVVPYSRDGFGHQPGRVPVDVYDSTGVRVFAGWMTSRFAAAASPGAWMAASGDFVYGVGEPDQHGEATAVRYRLQEPF